MYSSDVGGQMHNASDGLELFQVDVLVTAGTSSLIC